jgi:hypothetical protein
MVSFLVTSILTGRSRTVLAGSSTAFGGGGGAPTATVTVAAPQSVAPAASTMSQRRYRKWSTPTKPLLGV